MSSSQTQRVFSVDGEDIVVLLIERPFREGREVQLTYRGETVVLGDLGLGDDELRERVFAEVRRIKERAD